MTGKQRLVILSHSPRIVALLWLRQPSLWLSGPLVAPNLCVRRSDRSRFLSSGPRPTLILPARISSLIWSLWSSPSRCGSGSLDAATQSRAYARLSTKISTPAPRTRAVGHWS
ncbi:hypothetical protein P170DRAFT_200994 [Aspergillus steynii IBT 23096]|uniref:Uncharacterized protein n=1 Tax=Aspergillus steynii IBT 23096 TaxID=1392250 RepID=A0A2I2G515_9EURO|nr:uncharacterized protein P170DRAFT_200994 [Aspergillus steynii IBT 23096]PLB47943.1 hypothetical protein P170DRAFT_200994 [Aspergillus steynii IBT 23096]